VSDLFDVDRPRKAALTPAPDSPLADRMRPRSLDEVEGPEEVVGSNGFLRRALAEDRVPSLIFWGPPGVGKTTLARLIATQTSSVFLAYSAIATGVKEMREVLEGARKLRAATKQRTILFLDEIHRFNRAQQDVFLPYNESGDIVLIGATTENPSFELNGALLSRCKVVVLDPLLPEAVARIVRRALQDISRGLGARDFKVDDEALSFIAQTSGGDARRALNLLEAAGADAEAGKTQRIEVSRLRDLLQRKVLLYDKAGEEHYNLISALHKSMRESDPDATIYWLVRMLEAGEEPLYLARRIVRFASEDIGLADPRALRVALDAKEAFDFLGLPEGSLALAEAAVYCALAPKSNALYEAEGEAKRDVAEKPSEPVPPVIRNAVTKLMKQVGYGRGYRYAPAEPEGVGGIECLPEALKGRRYYRPRASGEEADLAKRLEAVLQMRREKWSREEGDESDRKKRKTKHVVEARRPVADKNEKDDRDEKTEAETEDPSRAKPAVSQAGLPESEPAVVAESDGAGRSEDGEESVESEPRERMDPIGRADDREKPEEPVE
jgi:putative ATPase